jgi:hypothetical protein
MLLYKVDSMPALEQGTLFEEDQSFRQPWLWALTSGILAVVIVVSGLVLTGALVKPGGNMAPVIIGLVVGAGVVIVAAILMYVMKLSVRLDQAGLHIRFFPLLNRDISLDEIARWEARDYRPLAEYGGWGIRYGWSGTAYNVSGKRGVQLEFTNGKRLLIGSQRADELAEAISQAKHRAS